MPPAALRGTRGGVWQAHPFTRSRTEKYMAGRKVFVQMGQSKSAKHKAGHKQSFAGALHGKRPEELISLAVAETRKAAEGGDARAQYLLGMAYAEGSGVRQENAEAFRWFMKAAELGLAEAQSRVAAMHSMGAGCPQSSERAAAWWCKAAEQGEPTAVCCYGLALCRGDGVAQDVQRGFSLLRQAAKAGVPQAAELLRTPEMIAFAMQC